MHPTERNTSSAAAPTLLQQKEDSGPHTVLQPGPGDGSAAQHRQRHQGALTQWERPVQVWRIRADPPGGGVWRGDQDPTDQGTTVQRLILTCKMSCLLQLNLQSHKVLISDLKKTNFSVMLCVCRVRCCKPEEEDAPSCSLTSRRWNRKLPRCKDLRGKKNNLIIYQKSYLWHITMNLINRKLVMWMFLDVSTAILKKETWAKKVLPSLLSLFHNTPNNIWSITVHVLFGSQS